MTKSKNDNGFAGFSSFSTFAQQDAQYTQYSNPININPAYAGSRGL